MTLVQKLRVMLHSAGLSQDDYSTICEAIRALGDEP